MLVFCFSSLFSGYAAAATGVNSFRFIVMGDSRPILATLPQSPPFKRILWETDLIGPELAFHVGDLVFGYMSDSDTELPRQYEDLAATLKSVVTPFYFAIGNHEIGSQGGKELYQQNVGKLYFSFDYGNSHFIILDSDWGEFGDTGTIGQEQLEWLKKDLLANQTKKKCVRFHAQTHVQ